MDIQLDDKYRLSSDDRQWLIQKQGVLKGEVIYTSIAFFKDINQAISYYVDLSLRKSDAYTVADALAECKNIATRLTVALTPEFNVSVK